MYQLKDDLESFFALIKCKKECSGYNKKTCVKKFQIIFLQNFELSRRASLLIKSSWYEWFHPEYTGLISSISTV